MDTSRNAWTSKAEAAICALRDVEGASIQMQGDEVREIHVLTRSSRPAKLIVRDVQTVLLTRFNRHIDYRVVSVAHTDSSGDEERPPEAGAPARPKDGPRPRAAAREEPKPEPKPDAEREERIRYAGVNLFVSGPRTQAQVELRWKGLPRMGSASGWSTRAGAGRLVAKATLAAVQEFLTDDVAIGVHHVETVRLGRRRAMIVALSMLADRSEKILVGSAALEHDPHQAVVLATLSALNRVVGGLPTREPTEYILRPTST